ncbi:DUF5361 domain-containing protein [uncultured Anaerococcus sp.]|uniref:DUF5361 domain-containing protein n=1 Tax=uncultured Anaerococcus sp. TaxID=293428 RepID=UPI002803C92D|nr:DUF5361 domain-containing protein [uncultured Anaerococcus sp.]
MICDLAETYGIYDYKQLPLYKVAVFCRGLRNDSRVKMKISGQKFNYETMLLAGILDANNWLVWSKSKDGQKNKNKPKPVLKHMYSDDSNKNNCIKFSSSKDFENARKKAIEAIKKGGKYG